MTLLEQAQGKLSKLSRPILDFLFPKSTRVLSLESMSSSKLLECLPPSEKISDDTIAVFDYGHTLVKEVVWEVKYKGNRDLADRLGEILYDVIYSELSERNIFEKTEHVLILPSPVSDKRRFERGWNQAELLSQAVKKRDTTQKFKYLPRQLAKVVHTESQTHTGSKSERLANLHNSMKILNPLSVQDQYVVLIDDVTTTGATFKEAKRVLKEAGAKRVLCVALTH